MDAPYENIIRDSWGYGVRPLAFLSDIYLFSWFWDNLYALLLIITVMHIANTYLLYQITKKIGIPLGIISLTLFAVSPILMEALYWISASTRIVFSLFLCLLSIHLFLKSLDEEKVMLKLFWYFSSILLNLICVGYYEQTVAVNLFLFGFVLVSLKKYRYLWIPLLSTIWIGVWYVYFMVKWHTQGRGTLNLTNIFATAKYCMELIYTDFKEYARVFIYSGRDGLVKAFGSVGTTIEVIVLLCLIGALVYYIYHRGNVIQEKKRSVRQLWLGIGLWIAPCLPFVILNTYYIALRNLYLPLLGGVLVVEYLIEGILTKIKNEKLWEGMQAGICAMILFSSCFVIINEVDAYRSVHEIDNHVAQQVIQTLGEDFFEQEKSMAIFYDRNDLIRLKKINGHLDCVCESDWAMQGKIQVMRQKMKIGPVYINPAESDADAQMYFDAKMNLVKVVLR